MIEIDDLIMPESPEAEEDEIYVPAHTRRRPIRANKPRNFEKIIYSALRIKSAERLVFCFNLAFFVDLL